MPFTQSRSALPVTLERYELDALIEWHRNEEYRCADIYAYSEAETHRSRKEQLEELQKKRGEEMRAEALEQTKRNLAAQFTADHQ